MTERDCRHCGDNVPLEDANWVVGWGHLCPDCDSRATVRKGTRAAKPEVSVRARDR